MGDIFSKVDAKKKIFEIFELVVWKGDLKKLLLERVSKKAYQGWESSECAEKRVVYTDKRMERANALERMRLVKKGRKCGWEEKKRVVLR